jgi:hypothetical protein
MIDLYPVTLIFNTFSVIIFRMKLSNVTAFALLLILAACRVASPLPPLYPVNNVTSLLKVIETPLVYIDAELGADSPPIASVTLVLPAVAAEPIPSSTPISPQTEWQKYVCRGEKLTQASKLDREKAAQFATPIDSEWDGTLEAELKLWGYELYIGFCDFSNIADQLRALNIDSRFKPKGGQNECFSVRHSNIEATNEEGEEMPVMDQTYTVNGKTYRVSGWFIQYTMTPKDSTNL